MMTTTTTSRPAWLHMDGWAGRGRDAIVVVGETPTRWRIMVAGSRAIRLAGRHRWLAPGATALVPRYAVTFDRGDGEGI